MGKYISSPEESLVLRQASFFNVDGFKPSTLKLHPKVSRDIETLKSLLNEPRLGIDLEFDFWRDKTGRMRYKPTIVAVATSNRIYADAWKPENQDLLKKAFEEERITWIAHAGIGADKPVIDEAFEMETPLEIWEDSMITHYLSNMHLVKQEGKEESDDTGALGMMDLWTATSLISDVYNWKNCAGVACWPGRPCPIHNPIDYCGLDAWAGVICKENHEKVLSEYKVSKRLIECQHVIAQVCHEMENNGVRIDLDYVRSLDEAFEQKKNALFPFHMEGKKQVYELFNPKSNPAILEFFGKYPKDVDLKSTEKAEILKALEKLSEKRKIPLKRDEKTKQILGFDCDEDRVDEVCDAILRLYLYKNEGKGLDSWFGKDLIHNPVMRPATEEEEKKYKVKELPSYGYIHSRLISVGASTGRLSSSRPNMTNVPARGFGDFVRTAVVPRDPATMDLCKADYAQLELRCVLYLGGKPYEGSDIFTWLVGQTGETFMKIAAEQSPAAYAKDPIKAARQVAKGVAYGNLYGEGMILIDPRDLSFGKIRKEIDAGAIRIYTKGNIPWLKEDWMYCGQLVGFTGINMAERIYGEASIENRKKSLEMQEDVFFAHPQLAVIRQWQKSTMDFVQDNDYARGPDGHFTRLLGMPKDCAKAGLSVVGQGSAAFHVRGIVERFKKEQNRVPLLVVHDELVFEQPKTLTDAQVVEYIRLMEEETEFLPGFKCPIEAKRGPNWKKTREIYKG